MVDTINRRHRKGFTMVELIIVIGLLAILAVIAVPNVSGYVRKGRVVKASSDATALASAINIYNTTIGLTIEGTGDLPPNLRQELLDRHLLPQLSGDFDLVMGNVIWDNDTRLFVAKNPPDVDGY